MKIQLVNLHVWQNDPLEYEAFVSCGVYAQFGYGETPLLAARYAWRSVRRMLINDVTNQLVP